MKKILIIGNSFGTDAARYLYGVSRRGGEELRVVNLFIGSCSLYRHYRCMLSEEQAYSYELNGHSTGLFVSLKQALLLDEWDYVVFQQCSPKSGEYETYQPYLSELSAYMRKLCPPAKQCLHLTWTFAEGCPRFDLSKFQTREDMQRETIAAYRRASKEIGTELIIPSAIAMWKLYEIKGAETYRDGFHCNLGMTRYMLACLWFSFFTGRSCIGNDFRDFDIPVSPEDAALAERLAWEAIQTELQP